MDLGVGLLLGVASTLVPPVSGTSNSRSVSKKQNAENLAQLLELLKKPGNANCADCNNTGRFHCLTSSEHGIRSLTLNHHYQKKTLNGVLRPLGLSFASGVQGYIEIWGPTSV
jgi:hypothetical protein